MSQEIPGIQSAPLVTGVNTDDTSAGPGIKIDVKCTDSQEDVTYRGYYAHAEKAGLPYEERVKFADKWKSELYHHDKGNTSKFTDPEFSTLKKTGSITFYLSPKSLSDLREQQAAYSLSQQQKTAEQANVPSVSAPQYNNAETAVNWLTDKIQWVTGGESEAGKQFNRLSVSGLRLLGYLKEQENRLTGTINDTVRYVAPDSVDGYLDKADESNRQTAAALKNANTNVTNDDKYSDILAEKQGIKRSLDTDLHRRLMYFPEAIPNAVESAIKGDFKDDDGSYSDKVGKIIGGLNPIGDIRDIAANIKNVHEGKPGSKIALGAAIIGSVPGAGDILKPIIKRVGAEIADEVAEKAVKEAGEAGAEKLLKTEGDRLVNEVTDRRYDDIAKTGHGPQRHGVEITEKQLNDRAEHGIDPITGTKYDAFRKDANDNPLLHRSGKDATKFTSKEAFVKTEAFVRGSQTYKNALKEANLDNSDQFAVEGIRLEDIFGAGYKEQVFGKTRVGTKSSSFGTVETDFTDGTIKAAFKKDDNGQWYLETMYPEPKK